MNMVQHEDKFHGEGFESRIYINARNGVVEVAMKTDSGEVVDMLIDRYDFIGYLTEQGVI